MIDAKNILVLSDSNYVKAVMSQDLLADTICPGCLETISNTPHFRGSHGQKHQTCSMTLDDISARSLIRQMIRETDKHNGREGSI